jgi:hypothetical protein
MIQKRACNVSAAENTITIARVDVTEEAFLRYRMAVVERMPDSPSKRALIVAIQARMEALARSATRARV